MMASNGSNWGPKPERKTIMGRLNNISSTALHDFVDITVFLILGALLAALVEAADRADRYRYVFTTSSRSWRSRR